MTLPTVSEVAAEAEEFVDEHWSDAVTVREWWRALADRGYSMPALSPEDGGLGWPPELVTALGKVLRERGALAPPGGIGMLLTAPTVALRGSAEQRRRFLPSILDGTLGWCQLFSEPQAGSDLAGLQTRAVRDGDEWVVTGQKVWTSMAQYADRGLLLARTDLDAPKHQGITYFLIRMDQPGVEVRPLVEMTGRAFFNEVFLDGARVDHADVLGDPNGGWAIANDTLRVERAGVGHSGAAGFSAAVPGEKSGHLDRPAAGFVTRRSAMGTSQVTARIVGRIAGLAKDRGTAGDPLVRQQLAALHTGAQIGHMTAWRAGAERGRGTGVEGNLAKIRTTEGVHRGREIGGALAGPALVAASDDDDDVTTLLRELTVFSPAPSIYSGTDEIQRNLIGERGLGLPKEPGPSRETPFRDLPKN
jgi:alkylation response protein AidB-like acyl-CoA dehydrogenase